MDISSCKNRVGKINPNFKTLMEVGGKPKGACFLTIGESTTIVKVSGIVHLVSFMMISL